MKKLLFFLPLLLVACFDKDDGNYILKFNHEYLEVSAKSHNDTIFLFATQDWTGEATGEANWVKITPTEGQLQNMVPATFRIVFEVEENTDVAPRTLIFHVKDKGNNCYTNFQLTQKGVPVN